jgi:toxin CcdB
MAQYMAYRNPVRQMRDQIPFVLDVQTDYLHGLSTRLVAPLLSKTPAVHAADRLNPIFLIDGQWVMMDTPNLRAMLNTLLREPVADLREHRYVIGDAMDFLLSGF